VLALAFAVGCGGNSGGGEGTPGTAGSTGGSASAGHGGTTGSAGSGQAGSSQAGTGGSASGTGGVGAVTGTAGNGSAGTMGAAGNGAAGAAGNGSAGTMGAGGASAGSGGRGGAAGGAGGRGGGNAGGGGRGGSNAGSGGSSAGRGGSGGAIGGAAGTGTGGAAGSGAGGSGTPGMSAGCGKSPGIASSMYNTGTRIPITAANMQRRYILNVPKNYDSSKAYRLVIAFHQRDGNDVQMYNNGYYHLLNLDTNNTTIFVAPNGQKNGSPCTVTTGSDSMCGWPNPNNSDFALADAVVAQVEDNFCVDTNRIFANGWSFGGAMSYETACARPLGATPGYIRAIAVYSGSAMITQGPCPPTKPVAYYASHGTSDNVLDYDGGVTMAQNFAKVNGCTWTTPTKVTSGNHVCTSMTGCTTGYPVEFCSFNGGHTPDPSDGGGGSWEYQNVWTFFSQF
jgi:poly(3-hydroxybutyrate) depolymerase